VKKAGKDKERRFWQPNRPTHKRGNSNGTYNCPKDRSRDEAHYFHYSWSLDRYVPGTWYWLLPALAVEEKVRRDRRKVPSKKEAGDEVRTVRRIDGPREV